MLKRRIIFFLLAMAICLQAMAAGPGLINYSGRLTDNAGVPVTAPTAVVLTFWNAASDGDQLGGGYDYQATVAPNTDGVYSLAIGDAGGTGGPVPGAIFDSAAVWLNVNVGGEDLLPRARITSVGYAFQANQADTATTATVAINAQQADQATFAQAAATATMADSATQADQAASALNADQADTATTATVAINAQQADQATFAQAAATATMADSATQADQATSALNADQADTATTATVAINAQQADQADTAITALAALALDGGAYVTVRTTGTAIENGNSLLAAYAQAKTLTPGGEALTTKSRAVVLVPPGRYDLGTKQLVMDAEFVDLVGLSSARANQHIFGTSNGEDTGVLRQTANNVRIENLTVECTRSSGGKSYNASDPAAYFPDSDKPAAVIRNCEFQADESHAYSMRIEIEYSGYYENCTGGRDAFGGYSGTASGTFTNCTGGDSAFGSIYGTVSGIFKDCTGGDYAFGGSGGAASGTFTNCTGGFSAFGGDGGAASGTFTDCTGAGGAFGGEGGTASGTFTNCTGAAGAFGSGNRASGTFTNCIGGGGAFGGFGGMASGTFTDCTGGSRAFGGFGGMASGTFTNCTGAAGTFGGGGGGGTALGGKFYYCYGGADSFTTTGSPVVIHCIKDNATYP